MNGRLERTGPVVHEITSLDDGRRMTSCGIKYVLAHQVPETEEIDCMACIAITGKDWLFTFLETPWPWP